MGCDIHLYVEKRNEDGKWELQGGFVSDWYIPGHEYGENRLKELMNSSSPVEARSYALFGVLADVRNHHPGDFDNSIMPVISTPRGLPEDMCEELQLAAERDRYPLWLGDHSFSWLLLSEIEEFFRDSGDMLVERHGAKQPVSWWCKEFIEQTIPQLVKRSEAEDHSDIRLVFGFDS